MVTWKNRGVFSLKLWMCYSFLAVHCLFTHLKGFRVRSIRISVLNKFSASVVTTSFQCCRRFAIVLEWLDEGKWRWGCSPRGDVTHVSQLKGSSSDYWWHRRVHSQYSPPTTCWRRKPGPDWFIQAAKVWLWRHLSATLETGDSLIRREFYFHQLINWQTKV